MENNLSKAISQINKVVQLLKTARMIDLDHKVLIEHLNEAAEMINGLDGRGNLQEGVLVFFADYIQRCVVDRGQMTHPALKEATEAYLKSLKAPDRQVKSAEEIFKEHIDSRYYHKTDILKAMEIYAQQYK